MRKFGWFLMTLLLLVLLVGCSNEDKKSADTGETKSGGTLKVAISAQPPTLDVHLTTSSDAINVTSNIYETLVTQNGKQQAVPMLAESIETSDDGLLYTFKLRQGVKFHNGNEMKAKDVVASMNRWLEKSSRAKLLLAGATFEEKDEYTVEMKLQEAASDVLDIMAGRGQFPAIMPAEIVESASDDGVSEYIGTGPFKFVEWKQDQYIKLEKFTDYAEADGEPDGLAGRKTVYVDDVEFHIVTDSSTRMAGVQTGEYDIALNMPFDNYDQLMSMGQLKTYASFDNGTINVAYNKKSGIMTNPEIRRAINTGIDAHAVMLAAVGNEQLFKLDPGYISPDNIDWATDAGKEQYNLADVEKAKQMLKDAGYNNEEVVLYSTGDYDHQYNASVVLKEQLSKMGINAKLEIYDWPTLQEKRSNPENWDVMILGTGYVTTPSQLLVINPTFPGWTEDDKVTALLTEIRKAETKEAAKEKWAELQQYMWDDYMPHTLFGHYASIITTTDQLEDLIIFNNALLWEVKKK
ncbi:ABC transporter substrate-binding protein [Sporosarcina cyprini]|uniref:ABC transporter substrate-binding protein n=1 Tax=Sporosarcina cyprini TaxID=2910523 RepID=UPI001EE11CFA|nr:ABC transporter substrate-binding protein [Sporosarcina cyprini]MCG3088236.1 ABC transporter substrate-binding protein [Sporosarcina cyprini]